MTAIGNERGVISDHLAYIKGTIKEYYEQLCAHKLHWKIQLPKFKQAEIGNLKRPITIKGNEPINNNLPERQRQTQMGSLVKSTKHLRKKYLQQRHSELPQTGSNQDILQ